MTVDDLKALPEFGSYAAIAGALGLSREAVRKWKSIPAEHCRRIEAHLGGKVTRYQLRPDVFGDTAFAELPAQGDLAQEAAQ